MRGVVSRRRGKRGRTAPYGDRTHVQQAVSPLHHPGLVRGDVDGRALRSLTLEHYPGMTEAELARIESEAQGRFELTGSLVVHRYGQLFPGDAIVLVVTLSRHRQSAFAAAEFLMDYLKSRAPFWKKETFADGAETWVDARDTDATALARWEPAIKK